MVDEKFRMLRLLLVSRNLDIFDTLSGALNEFGRIVLEKAVSGQKALEMVSAQPVDLVVSDEDLGDMAGLELAKRLLNVNPMINFAIVNTLPHDEFHEASEGLGIMSQLPENPGKKDAEALLATLQRIMGLSA